MSGLILKLRPYEELLINGVLVENGDRNTRLRVKTEGAHILRLRDALRPEEATTPLKRVYYVAQLAVAGQIDCAEAAKAVTQAIAAAPALAIDVDLRQSIARGDFYQVMRSLRDAAFADRSGARHGARAAAI